MSHDPSLRENEKDLLVMNQYSPEECTNFSIHLIDVVSSLLGVDPTTTPIHLDEHINLDALDDAYRFHKDDDTCIITHFPIGGYLIACCTCGMILVYGEKTAHENGEVPLPASMRSSRQEKTQKITT